MDKKKFIPQAKVAPLTFKFYSDKNFYAHPRVEYFPIKFHF